MRPAIAARALQIAAADYDAGMTFGVPREVAMPILLRAAMTQAEREAELAGLPAAIADDLADARDEVWLIHQGDAYGYGPERLPAATARLDRARAAASAASTIL